MAFITALETKTWLPIGAWIAHQRLHPWRKPTPFFLQPWVPSSSSASSGSSWVGILAGLIFAGLVHSLAAVMCSCAQWPCCMLVLCYLSSNCFELRNSVSPLVAWWQVNLLWFRIYVHLLHLVTLNINRILVTHSCLYLPYKIALNRFSIKKVFFD